MRSQLRTSSESATNRLRTEQASVMEFGFKQAVVVDHFGEESWVYDVPFKKIMYAYVSVIRRYAYPAPFALDTVVLMK